ncbi:MAG TPA: peptide-methionine (S)-S-oxide reductase MsrA [Candidatus Baltobacteraceae bacterium]|nr:peptide-methionine (S)-S-oxide reductase MsrA [Candidatus Baltobacteraceae bacterium]
MTMLRRLFVLVLASALWPACAAPVDAAPPRTEQAVLAGGCFWGIEAVFEQLRGVSAVVAGFSGGDASTAHYDVVENGTTGHAESVRITFDPAVISYRQLLRVYFTVAHDPTELDRQGPDQGTQYRSAIFYANDAQRRDAEESIRELTAAHAFAAPIVTQVVPLRGFYPAEAYHQHFVERHPDYPYVVINDVPKLDALRKKFPALVKSNG